MITQEDQKAIDEFAARLAHMRTLAAIRGLQARKEILETAIREIHETRENSYIFYELRGFVAFCRWYARQNNNIRHGWAEDKFPEELQEFRRYLMDTTR